MVRYSDLCLPWLFWVSLAGAVLHGFPRVVLASFLHALKWLEGAGLYLGMWQEPLSTLQLVLGMFSALTRGVLQGKTLP